MKFLKLITILFISIGVFSYENLVRADVKNPNDYKVLSTTNKTLTISNVKDYLKKGDKFSLLQKTILRILPLKNLQKPILVCNEQHRFIVAEQMREINIEDFIILLESCVIIS